MLEKGAASCQLCLDGITGDQVGFTEPLLPRFPTSPARKGSSTLSLTCRHQHRQNDLDILTALNELIPVT